MGGLGEPLERFQGWLEEAAQAGLAEPTAVTLSTLRPQGGVSARTVLLKQVDERGFVFYTNVHSRKGQHLCKDPRVALCFLWAPLKRQVLVEGEAAPVSAAEADAYWRTRPRDSQLGAWASRQSEPLEDMATLESRFRDYRERYAGRDVPRPEHWSGYRVVPEMIEFWTGRDARLHERVRYSKRGNTWTRELINP